MTRWIWAALCAAVLCTAMPWGVAAAEPMLVVTLRTDLRPNNDFRTVRTTVREAVTKRLVGTFDHPARTGERYDQRVRVLEKALGKGRYQVTVQALGLQGQLVAERQHAVRHEGGVQVVDAFLTVAQPVRADCDRAHSAEKRTCGRVLAACIKELRGNRGGLKG
ncbi:MAG: hypothetical protein KC613_00875, partial [Myxococcales bacterium]|nr:hypothetical protein [Myxococcales bacterium]